LSITDERLEELISHLPDEIKQKVINLKKKLKEAFDNQDIKMMIEAKDELMKLRKEYLNDIDNNDSNESSKNDDFDINDFK
jgi:predicted outer membrane protein